MLSQGVLTTVGVPPTIADWKAQIAKEKADNPIQGRDGSRTDKEKVER